MGPLSNRIQTLCLANATAAISRLSLRVVWLKDEGMIYVPPSEILLGGGGGAGGGRSGGESARSRGKFTWGRREPKRGDREEVTMAGERGGGGAKGGGRGGGPMVIDTGGALSPVTATRAFLAHPFVPKTMRFGQCGRSSAALDPSEAERLSLDVWVSVRALNRTNFVSAGGSMWGGSSVWANCAEWLSLHVWVSVRALNRTNFVSAGGSMWGGSSVWANCAEWLSLHVWVSVRALNRTNFVSAGGGGGRGGGIRAIPSLHASHVPPCSATITFSLPQQQEKVVGCLVLEEFHHCYVRLQPSVAEKVVGCLVLEEFHRCYARLQPSEAVRGIVESTNLNMTLVTQSTAIYVDPPSDQSSCSGCPPGRQISDCVARSIAMEILRRPSIELTIASQDPSHPTAIADFFDRNRAPFMPPSAEFRAARCTEPAIKKLMATPGLMDAEPGSPAGPGRPKLPGTPGSEGQMGGAKGTGGGGFRGSGGGGGGGGSGGVKGRQGHANVSVDELVKVIGMVAERGKEAIGLVEDTGRVDAGAVERARRVLIACQQHEFAELLLLANTQAMLHMRPSPAADFIRARALARNPSFRMLPPVCYSPPIPPIPRQLFAKFFVVERECYAVSCPTVQCHAKPCCALARNPSFRMLPPVCHTSPIPPIPRQLFAKFFVVEPPLNLAYCGLPKVACMWLRAMLHLPLPTAHCPSPGTHLHLCSPPHTASLNLAYCGLPKVACTSWRMWLRAMLHLPKPEDHLLAHSYEASGLGDLSQKFTEKEATRAMTRRGLFKFTFVRNPFSRVVSTYLNKLVVTDAPDRTKGWGTREFWNKELFGSVQPFFDLLKDPATQLVSFHDFMRLVEHLIRGQKPLDRHITPQVDLCALDHIQYDYVGHFENLEDGVRVVTARYNHSNIHLFKFGKEAHATGTDLKLARLYDAETVRRVSKVYSKDFNITLNNIHFDVPPVLQKLIADE
ncbi:unnamed protein product [Closterium sp. NIES-64]|nr:unnamed protein product [Closterium sp. NIES-64]